jgi:hypothetical protein
MHPRETHSCMRAARLGSGGKAAASQPARCGDSCAPPGRHLRHRHMRMCMIVCHVCAWCAHAVLFSSCPSACSALSRAFQTGQPTRHSGPPPCLWTPALAILANMENKLDNQVAHINAYAMMESVCVAVRNSLRGRAATAQTRLACSHEPKASEAQECISTLLCIISIDAIIFMH